MHPENRQLTVDKSFASLSLLSQYLSGYLDEEQFIPDVSVDAIMKAAGMVEAVLNGTAKPRKDLIVKNNESEQLSMFSV